MLLVHGLDVGGAEAMIAQLAQHLRRRGDAVEIGCLDALGALGEELRRDGFDLVVHDRRPGFDRTLAWRLARRIRRQRVDVVHLHQRPAFFYGMLAGLLHGRSIVYTEHGPLLTPPRAAQRIFNRALGGRARHITAVSRDLQHRLATEEGFARHDIAVVSNAIDGARFANPLPDARDTARQRLGVPPHAPILGSVGRLEPVKNHAALVHVIARLRRRVPDARLVIAGEGAQSRPLAGLARDLGVADAVHLIGLQRDIEQLLPAFDVFCLPSLTEGIPLALLEAMAAGIPVVAAATGGIPEAARAGQDALLVDGEPTGESYVERFTAAVERLLNDPACGRRLAESARQRVRSEFDIETVCRRYREILAAAARV